MGRLLGLIVLIASGGAPAMSAQLGTLAAAPSELAVTAAGRGDIPGTSPGGATISAAAGTPAAGTGRARAMRPAPKTERPTATTSPASRFSPRLLMPPQGSYPLPLIGPPLAGPLTVTSPYGQLRRDPRVPGSSRHHSGIDLQARTPTPVLAVADGVVRRIHDSNTTAAGYYILIELSPPTAEPYSGPTVGYMHLKARSWTVAVGSRVTAGQVIAFTGSSANGGDVFATSGLRPHLHFEYNRPGSGGLQRRLGASVDPEGCIDVAPPPAPVSQSPLHGDRSTTSSSQHAN